MHSVRFWGGYRSPVILLGQLNHMVLTLKGRDYNVILWEGFGEGRRAGEGTNIFQHHKLADGEKDIKPQNKRRRKKERKRKEKKRRKKQKGGGGGGGRFGLAVRR